MSVREGRPNWKMNAPFRSKEGKGPPFKSKEGPS